MKEVVCSGFGGLSSLFRDFSRAGLKRVVWLSLVLAIPAQAGVLYRWTNEQGTKEISYSIPNAEAHRGYEILDSASMRVTEVVEPQMSDEEFQNKIDQEETRALCTVALDRVNFLYGTLEDIDAAESAAKRALELRMHSTKQNLKTAKRNLQALEAGAARTEQAGRELGEERLRELERAHGQIAQLERELVQRDREQNGSGLVYEEERRVFRLGSCSSEQPVATR